MRRYCGIYLKENQKTTRNMLRWLEELDFGLPAYEAGLLDIRQKRFAKHPS